LLGSVVPLTVFLGCAHTTAPSQTPLPTLRATKRPGLVAWLHRCLLQPDAELTAEMQSAAGGSSGDDYGGRSGVGEVEGSAPPPVALAALARAAAAYCLLALFIEAEHPGLVRWLLGRLALMEGPTEQLLADMQRAAWGGGEAAGGEWQQAPLLRLARGKDNTMAVEVMEGCGAGCVLMQGKKQFWQWLACGGGGFFAVQGYAAP
jgi:hypothetical protein